MRIYTGFYEHLSKYINLGKDKLGEHGGRVERGKESKYLINKPITITKIFFLLTGDPMRMNSNGKTKARTTIIHDREAHKLRRKKTTSKAMFDLSLYIYKRRALVNTQRDGRQRYLLIKGIV